LTDRRGWWRGFQVFLALLVLVLVTRSLFRQWDAFKAQEISWEPHVGRLVAAVVIVWLSYAVLVEGWRRVVLAMRQRLSYPDAVRICMVSNLGKYLPGKVWAIAGAALLAQRAGVDAGAAVAGAFTLQALALASGLILIAFLAPAAIVALGPAARFALAVVAGVALVGLILLTLPGLLGRVRLLLPEALQGLQAVPAATLAGGLGANLVAWGAYGLALQMLLRGLTPGADLTWSQATAVFTTSYLVGLIAAFAPGGLGPREFAFTLLLTPTLGPKLAAAMAVATRLLLTITELGAAAPFLPAARRSLRTPG
jgi:uncharacterized membrane protein YbhN (UPF0104 family)